VIVTEKLSRRDEPKWFKDFVKVLAGRADKVVIG
jgi:hypothetical protein